MALVFLALLLAVCLHVGATENMTITPTCDFTEHALDVNCRNRGLNYIPSGYSAAKSMDLRNNQLEILEAGVFQGFSDLQKLALEGNNILDIQKGVFGGCDSLVYIYLQFNSLQSIEEGAFEGAASLERLFLNQNSISQLHQDAFRGLGALTDLYIGHNEIKLLAPGFFRHTPCLKKLHIGDNRLTNLSSQIFAGLSDLSYLNIMNNNLNIIESGTFDPLKNLEELDLSGNLLISINDFPTLPKLKILNLYDNKMQEIGTLSGVVNGLDELYLGQNNLSCTCSMDPIREWIQLQGVKATDENLTCSSPTHVEGKVLVSISREDLCPSDADLGHVPTSPTLNSTMSTATTSTRHIEDNNSLIGLFDGLIAGATVFFIITIMCIFIKCLNWRTQRYHQPQEA